jgi:hypothetical protein
VIWNRISPTFAQGKVAKLVRGGLAEIYLAPAFYSVLPHLQKDAMMNEKDEQDTRSKFYSSQSVAKYIKAVGIPKTRRALRDMVASGSSDDLDSKKGLELISCLGKVVFMKHPQQINIIDKSNGKMIVSIA